MTKVVRDAVDLVALLSKYNVRLALSGHMHMLDRIDYRGVTFISEGAVSGAWWKGAHKGFAEGFGIVDCTPTGSFQHSYHPYGWKPSA